MTTGVMTDEDIAFAEELYERLPDELVYVAAEWEEWLLKPYGYEKRDQSRVAHAIHYLRRIGKVSRESVWPSGVRPVNYRRATCPRPRRVRIKKLSISRVAAA